MSDSCGPMDCSMPDLSVHYQLPEFARNSCTSSWWCHPTISSSVIPFSSCLQSFPSIRVFSNESVLHIRWPKYWSFNFSLSPSNDYSGLISCRLDWLDLLAVQETSQESSPTPQFKSINSLAFSFLYSPTLTSIQSVMPSNRPALCCPLILLPSIFSQHQGLFQWVSSSHQVTKVLEFQLQHQSFQWIFRTNFL